MIVPQSDGRLQTVVEQLRSDYPSDIFVPLDKDVHRRARVSPLGYLHRVATCFTTDDDHYKHTLCVLVRSRSTSQRRRRSQLSLNVLSGGI